MGRLLHRFDNNGVEIIINTQTGESFVTITGYSKLSGINRGTIKSRCQQITNSKVIQRHYIPTAGGRQYTKLIPEALIEKWLPNDNVDIANQLIGLGARAFMHDLAGFNVSPAITKVNEHVLPQSYLEALKALVKSEEEKQKLELQIQDLQLKSQPNKQESLLKLSETLTIIDKDSVSIGELAKAYNTGRNTFFKMLREIGFIMKEPSRLPYQSHIDADRAEVLRKERPHQPGIFDGVTVITAKGQIYIAEKLVEKERATTAEALLEATVELIG